MSQFSAGDGAIYRAEDLASSAVEVSHLYGFLARVFREEISAEFLGLLRTPRMRQDLAAVGIEFDESFFSADEAELLESLAVEYAALFLGPGGHVNTHESVQAEADGYLWGARTVEVRRFIEGAGVRYSENFSGIPDHIGVELEFMAMLARFEGEEWRAGNFERAANCLEYQREFLGRHLGAWYRKFCTEIIERAGLPIYPQIAMLLRDFVTSEIEDVPRRLQCANRQGSGSSPLEADSATGGGVVAMGAVPVA